MLIADTSLSNAMLEELVAWHCSAYGNVDAVQVLRQCPPDRVQAYALVKMATTDSALAVRRSFGDMMYGSTSIYIGLTSDRFQPKAARTP